ncbi:multicopper oxidase family protein [Pseudomonas sp. 148P]|uniref:Multicopper oxidase family protein n=1 Tax=Pseudomonas ulcerans TaxID=3115852 RepID=A0ABU7HUY8_9PSED|nr:MULTISPECIES: multicopper oxidase family protein [unclassified Pseudomonas]MEE1923593.1 multicopper oxidase family protein [Pseudomonas sp. 147P]MEE1935340.1 multicopper oxidase family protein [Pseudomonas sp. 148P]
MTGLHRNWPFGLTALALMCAGATAQAEEQARAFSNPPPIQQLAPTLKEARGTLLMKSTAPSNAVLNPHAGHERLLDLTIEYTNNYIYDPATQQQVPVYLRSYHGTDVDPRVPFVAPTIEVTPGDTVRINLDNSLPTDPSCLQPPASINTPHCFNGTNLHSHGLWVSPTGNSDNVLLQIKPEQKFQYEYNIPSDHPAGTFWYHPHLHGSTALQVGSGMAGALIIRGDRLPSAEANGDIDTLLKPIPGQDFIERLLVLQQIPYACVGAAGHGPIKKKTVIKNGKPTEVVDWSCNKGEVGVVESYDQFGPGDWQDSGRYTSVNGLVQPTFEARTGEVQRWRVVHAGVRDTVNLRFVKLKDSAAQQSIKGVAAAKSAEFIAQNCSGTPVPYEVIAADGLTYAKAQHKDQLTLQPGYRNDLLVTFPEKGRYCVIDLAEPANGGVTQLSSNHQLLGFVDAEGGQAVSNLDGYIRDTLVAAAKVNMPEGSVRDKVVADLQKDLSLSSFVPHRSIEDSELSGDEQHLVFKISTNSKGDTEFAIGTTADNAQPYDPAVVSRELKLGDAQRWVLQSALAGHPFHIHVNPFQIEKIIGPDGKDLSAPDAKPDTDGDQQYIGLKGVWKDTLFVKPLNKDSNKYYTVYVKTRYQRYIGEFVLHCHILDHEDQGMMQNVRISLDGKPGGAHGEHH